LKNVYNIVKNTSTGKDYFLEKNDHTRKNTAMYSIMRLEHTLQKLKIPFVVDFDEYNVFHQSINSLTFNQVLQILFPDLTVSKNISILLKSISKYMLKVLKELVNLDRNLWRQRIRKK
jgi:hypothetical protein